MSCHAHQACVPSFISHGNLIIAEVNLLLSGLMKLLCLALSVFSPMNSSVLLQYILCVCVCVRTNKGGTGLGLLY